MIWPRFSTKPNSHSLSFPTSPQPTKPNLFVAAEIESAPMSTLTVSAPSLLPLIDLCRHTSEFNQLHSTLIKLGLINNSLLSTRLVARCALSSSNVRYARQLFDCDPNPNTFIYNIMIRGHSQSSQPFDAIALFCDMIARGGLNATPNSMTFTPVLKACWAAEALEEGRQVHGILCKFPTLSDPFVQNALIGLYAKNGSFGDALKVFDRMSERDVVSWNTIIGGLVDLGFVSEAQELFDAMPVRNVRSWNCLIDGYAKCGSMGSARDLFERMTAKDGITWNTMIGGYMNCGQMEEAFELFRKMPVEFKDLFTLNGMIDGYSKESGSREVLELFNEMLELEIKPNNFTLVSVLSACSQLSTLEQGECIHTYIDRCGMKLDARLGTALSDMYAKCGYMERALEVFNDIDEKDTASWNSIISNLGIHGKGKEALQLFFKLLETRTKPDEITFLSVLSACRHCGLVEEGKRCFSIMSEVYNITPKGEHFGCMVDLLCRAGLLDEAKELIQSNSGVEFTVAMWGALLEAASRTGNIEMGKYAAEHLLELNPNDARCYVALSNLYSQEQKWEDSLKVRKQMRSSGMEKVPGCSSIKVNGVVHEFSVGSGFNTVDEI